MKRFAWVGLLLACGARTDLGGRSSAVDDAGSTGTCTPAPTPASCTAWHAGTGQSIATGVSGAATASGCGLIAAWSVQEGDTTVWSTQWIGFDGAALAPIVAHPSLTFSSTSSTMSLAEGGMLEVDSTGCHFVAVDASGEEQGAVKTFASDDCRSLSGAGTKWSFLSIASQGGGSLVTLDGATQTETPLVLAQPEYVWDRVVLSDGSFLASSFWEDANTATYTNWLTPFDAKGEALGPSVAVAGFDAAPLLLARAGDHAMAGWDWSTVEALPVDAKGSALASAQTITADNPIYELSLFTQPNGDVLVAWVVLGGPTNDMSLHARVVAPDGTPRGPETLLETGLASVQIHGAIESTGARAVLVLTTNEGKVEALPLTCQ
jgi:hypothetical protein